MGAARSKTALVLAGGGIMGAAYEIGVLSALERLLRPTLSTTRFDMYVGISAGSIIATLAAHGVSPHFIYRSIACDERRAYNWKRHDIYQFDFRRVFASCGGVLRNLVRIFRGYRQKRWELSGSEIFSILQEQFPAGLFSLDPLQSYLCRSFRKEGIVDDFHALRPELYIPAYDLDLGERVVFGTPGQRHMHICQAITASCAIPYFFQPYRIGDRYYIDGSTGRVTHIDVAIENGARLVLLINPRVPVRNDVDRFCLPSLSYGRCSSIADLGIAMAREQATRIESKEKLDLALAFYRQAHPEVDILVIEPGPEESVFFFHNPMSMKARNHIMAYGYHLTQTQLQHRLAEFTQVFARHGFDLQPGNLGAPPPAEIA